MMNLKKEINKEGLNIVLLGHIKPDGDCVGSVTALYQYIKKVNPNANVYMILDEFGTGLSHIKCIEKINNFFVDIEKVDICFCLDCASRDRLGKYGYYFDKAKYTIVIDHHVTNTQFGDLMNVFPDKSSTCEVLYDLMDKELIDKDIAISLYTGLISDTGVFKYPCTTEDTMKMGGFLISKGIDFSKIIDESFYEKPYKVQKFIAKAVLNSELKFLGKVIYTFVSIDMMQQNNIERKELDGIIEQLRNTSGVEVAIFIYEISKRNYKVSMRSKTYVDVSDICMQFGGGGHIRAAGFTYRGELAKIVQDIFKTIEKQI